MAVAVQQPHAPALGASRYAGFWIRVLAFLIDGLVIGVIASVVTLGQAGIVIYDHWLQPVAWRNFLETVVGFAYFTLLWSSLGGGQTLGMRVLGLRVVGPDGRSIGYGAAVVRWIGLIVSVAAIFIGLVWVAIDPRKQGWHDKMASTFVVGADAEFTPRAESAPAVPVTNPLARGFAVVLGMLGASVGLGGVALAVSIGDAVIEPGLELVVVAILMGLALVGAAAAWVRPSVAAIALGVAVVAAWVAFGPLLGGWYDGLVGATALGPSAETRYWFDAPVMGFLILSGMLMAVAALLALVAIDWAGTARKP